MVFSMMSRKKADIAAFSVLVGAIVILVYMGKCWPYIFLAIGGSLALRQYLRKRYYDVGLTCAVFIGLFLTFFVDIQWNAIMPIILVLGAVTIFYREFVASRTRSGSEQINDLKSEIDDAQHHQ